MKKPVAKKLSDLGLDVDFLQWLEGEADRLPRLNRVERLSGAKIAKAICGACWLEEQFVRPALISPHTPDEWRSRYEELQHFLWSAIKWSQNSSLLETASNLSALEMVLDTLLPASSWNQYRKDIQLLRKRGQPEEISRYKAPSRRSAGPGESEQTKRMRAAVADVSRVSKTPFAELAKAWNEGLAREAYTPEGILGRLRKGSRQEKSPLIANRLLDFWRNIYNGKLVFAFPGQFPLSSELAARFKWRPSNMKEGSR